ncbi:MAG: outer membrane beta-barrel protein [Burkholderiales bacterium]|nr:outer membrane beta-barrel protein [Burkholderiales bacterium]
MTDIETMRTLRLGAFLVAACSPVPAYAALDPTDVVQVQATASLLRDDNVYRLPDSFIAPPGSGLENRADTLRILGVGLKVDKMLSRQRLLADWKVNETTYDKNTNLDFVGGDGKLAWLWQAGNHWNGEASYRKVRTLGGFTDVRQSIKDLIDTETYTLTGGYQFHPRWRIGAEYIDLESTHSERRDLDSDARVSGLLLTYRTPADNTIGLVARRTERHYPHRTINVTTDNGHVETRLNVITGWRLSGAVRIDGHVGHVDVEHDSISQRDFSGLVWRAAAAWDPTAKLRLNFLTYRDLRLYEDLVSSYVVATVVGFSPVYAVTEKILLQADLNVENREYRGDPGLAVFAPPPTGEEKLRLARLTASYSPLRNLGLSLSFEAGDRKSPREDRTFDYRSWFGTIRVGF